MGKQLREISECSQETNETERADRLQRVKIKLLHKHPNSRKQTIRKSGEKGGNLQLHMKKSNFLLKWDTLPFGVTLTISLEEFSYKQKHQHGKLLCWV